MDGEATSTDQPKPCWFIDLNWYQQNNRSFSALAQGYLCTKCRNRLNGKGKEIAAADLLSTIKDCCGNNPDFITTQMPILESIFRLFLANGNQPLDLEELGKRLSERRGGDIYRTSVEILSRLLRNEQYYGIRLVLESGELDR